MDTVSGEMRAKVLLVGPYPPPFGGISATVRDLYQILVAEQGYEVTVLNIGERRMQPSLEYLSPRGGIHFVRLLLQHAFDGYVIHLETNGHNFKSWLTALVCSVCGLFNRQRSIIAFGSGMLPDYMRNCSLLVRVVVKVTSRCAGFIICRNDEMVVALQEQGCPRDKIKVLPGFVGIKGRKTQPVPTEVKEFFKRHDPVLGAAVSLSPEYGIPLALQVVADLRPHYPKVGLILMGIGQAESVALEDLGPVKQQVLLAGVLPPDVALGVMANLTLFLRPTYCDGDSISVREALALGVPVVASAAGMRPSSVKTFEVGSREDLCKKVQQLLTEISSGKPIVLNQEENRGSGDTLLKLYETLFGGSALSINNVGGH